MCASLVPYPVDPHATGIAYPLNQLPNSDAAQWHSQDIAVARAQHGHTSTLRLYELLCEVQKLIGGSGDILPSPPQKFWNFTASQVGSETIYRSEV